MSTNRENLIKQETKSIATKRIKVFLEQQTLGTGSGLSRHQEICLPCCSEQKGSRLPSRDIRVSTAVNKLRSVKDAKPD